MAHRTPILIGCGIAALAWMLGYEMGGGFHLADKSTTGVGDSATTHGRDASSQQAGSQNIIRPAADALADQIAARHIPWTRERVAQSIGAIKRDANILRITRMALKLADQLSAEDFPAVIEIANGMNNEARDESKIFALLAKLRWAELDPKASANYVVANEQLTDFLSLDSMVLMSWGASDPTAALAWAEALPDKEKRARMISQILEGTARSDPDTAIALARAHAPEMLANGSFGNAVNESLGKDDPERKARTLVSLGINSQIESAASEWAAKDFSAAMQWAQELPDEKNRTEALTGAWTGFALQRPEEAAAQFSKNSADAPFIRGVSQIIIGKLMEKDPQQAVRWAASLQQPEARLDAFSALGTSYGPTANGGQWLKSLPAGPERDGAIESFVTATAYAHPQEGAEWAMTIQNPKTREDSLRRAFGDWCRNDFPAAINWLQTSPTLSEENRQAILKKK